MKSIKPYLLIALLMNCLVCMPASAELISMDDQELSATVGQALYNTTYIAPGASGNNNRVDGSTTANVGFYRLGLQANVELNLNANRIQLGCGGVNGPGCDIDLSNVSLSGLNQVNGSYAGSDAVLKNPFIEFAIKNPGSSSLSTREVVGFRLGAAEALGLLSIGKNGDLTTPDDDTGIRTISGDIGIQVTNANLTRVRACAGLLVFGACLGGWLNGTANVPSYATTLTPQRGTTFNLGPMTANASILSLTLRNVNVNNIPYAAVHQLQISKPDGTPTNDLSLSLQRTPITWQKLSTGDFSSITAQRGWWISIPQAQFNDLEITQQVSLSGIGAIAGAILNTPVNINPIDLGQMPAQNCYGGLKFC